MLASLAPSRNGNIAPPVPITSCLQDRLSGLERQVECDAKARKDLDDSVHMSVLDTIRRLEMTLNAEIQRRTQAASEMQSYFDAKVANMQEKLEETFLQRFDHVHSMLESIGDRTVHIEKGFVQSRELYIKDAQERAATVRKDSAALSSVMQAEFRARREREGHISERLRVLESQTAEKFVRGQQICDQKFDHLHEMLQGIRVDSESGDRRFQARVIEEVSTLKDSLVCEAQGREQADDDIVSALNHYTKELQRALRALNQTV